jgi:hypothetical protein
MRLGKLRQDDSSHWYLIPSEFIQEHDQLAQDIDRAKEESGEWYNLIDEYDCKYSQYRLDGGLYDVNVLVELKGTCKQIKRIHVGDMVTSSEHAMTDRLFTVTGAKALDRKDIWDELDGLWMFKDYRTGEEIECLGCFITVWKPVSRPSPIKTKIKAKSKK